ncbi:MAG: ABC transporter permease, partial [Deltaproteobacteria bacterium]|nr:ABC transporter permease [Deltaproteobacteria bacterium]
MSKSRIHEIWQQSWQHRSFVIGIILSFIMLLTGVVSLFWTPYSVELLDIPHKLQGASTAHWLGTDHFGRDVFSMLMVGAWNSMLVSVFAIGFGAGIGVPLGALAAGKRGWVEETVMRFND